MPTNVTEMPAIGYVDLERTQRFWNIKDIFTGPNGTGVICPNVDDTVLDWDIGFFRVSTIDITTGLSTLVPWELTPHTDTDVTVDVLLGVGTGTISETWRVYIDTRQMPYSMQVDGRVHLYRSDATHYKVFKGTDISETGVVISSYYSSSQEFLGENIPLEHVGTDDINNWAIWAPKAGNTNVELPNGEVVTVVLYNAAGNMLSYATMLVQNTALVRRSESGRKSILSIGLKSPYLSEADPSMLIVPINVDIKTVVLTGVVRYNTGETMDVPITLDGTGKMSLHGLRWYTPTIQSYPMKLTLSYRLSDDEYSIEHGLTENGFITQACSIKADAADNAYSLKLYTYPTWNNASQQYDLDFWLYNLDRDVYYRLPRSIVETPEGEVVFDGQNYTTRQRLKFGVKLSNVDPALSDHRFVQSSEIILRQTGVEQGTKWQVKLDPTQAEFFGEGVKAVNTFINTNLSTISLKNECTSLSQWLDKLFYAINPLFDDTSEVRAPAPTHFVIQTKSRTYEFAVTQWDQSFSILNDVKVGETVYVRWLKDMSNTRLELGVTGLAVEQSN